MRQGIRWVMEYYYRGVVSWDWFYPHHYAPMISDMTGLAQIRVAFEPGQPFRPFQQLLAVLPAASAKLLPSAYQVPPQPCLLSPLLHSAPFCSGANVMVQHTVRACSLLLPQIKML